MMTLSKPKPLLLCAMMCCAMSWGAGQANAGTLTTPSFIVDVKVNCEEGNVTCDDVRYVGTSRKTGKRIALHGATKQRMCADGVTPCQFLGYEFRHGATVYQVLDDGRLIVTQGKKVVLQEQGTWQW